MDHRNRGESAAGAIITKLTLTPCGLVISPTAPPPSLVLAVHNLCLTMVARPVSTASQPQFVRLGK